MRPLSGATRNISIKPALAQHQSFCSPRHPVPRLKADRWTPRPFPCIALSPPALPARAALLVPDIRLDAAAVARAAPGAWPHLNTLLDVNKAPDSRRPGGSLRSPVSLVQVTDPYLNLFRGIVPPLLGTIDFTPLLGACSASHIMPSLSMSPAAASHPLTSQP